MSHHITTHDSEGNAIFSTKVPTEHIPLPIPNGNLTLLSTTHNFPINVSTESDIDQYAHDRTNGLGQRLCPENGVAVAILAVEPNKASPFHRTMTFDTMIVIEGVMELELDSGEKRTLKAGDSMVQRAGMHKWTNVTPNDRWARAVAIAQPIVEPLDIGGKKLETDFVV